MRRECSRDFPLAIAPSSVRLLNFPGRRPHGVDPLRGREPAEEVVDPEALVGIASRRPGALSGRQRVVDHVVGREAASLEGRNEFPRIVGVSFRSNRDGPNTEYESSRGGTFVSPWTLGRPLGHTGTSSNRVRRWAPALGLGIGEKAGTRSRSPPSSSTVDQDSS